MQWRDQAVHLMGIGGAGMSALVPLLQREGARCSGCDLTRSATVAQCERKSVPVSLGHDLAHLQDVDVVVYSSAVPQEHEELREARLRGINVMSRASCLAELMRGRKTVAVAGSHGKTTTTWMLGHLLNEAHHDPVIMCGGSLNALEGVGGQAGAGHLFVAEVDESDGGFLHVDPSYAVLTNLEAEHIRHYGSFEALCQAVRSWLMQVDTDGAIVISKDALLEDMCAEMQAPVIVCGIDAGDYTCTDIDYQAEGTDCSVCYQGQKIARVHIPMPGEHNILNALCAIAVARVVDPNVDVSTLSSCERVDRRFSVRGCVAGVRVVEDYGHHPTEIAATIAAAKMSGHRVHVIFQPHRYSRTADSFHEFLSCFDQAHAVAIMPIYAAHEEAMPGVSARRLAESVSAHQRLGQTDKSNTADQTSLVQYAAHFDEAIGFMKAHASDGDTILILGAGDIHHIVSPMIEALAAC